jgi:DNA polymerase III delta subunit
VLCLVATEVKKDAPLVKAVAKTGSVLVYEIEKKKTVGWVADRFRSAGIRVDAEAAALLVALVGETDKHALAQEIDKVVTWARSDPDVTVGEREILDLVAPWGENPPWAITDAWAAHDPARALRAVQQVLHHAGTPQRRRDEAARLAATLGSHLGKLRRVGAAAAAGERPGDYAQRTKQHRFPVDKLYRQVEGMSASELDDATRTLARLDVALKGGSRLASELELQRAVTALSVDRARRA